MTCQDFDRLETRYLSGELDGAASREIETHAASCARCEVKLESSTRRDVSEFAPPLPAELRAQTLERVRQRARVRRVTRTWQFGSAAIAASIVAVVLLNMPTTSASIARTTPVADTGSTPATAAVLALRSSRTEFDALDQASRELDAAIAAAPDDQELRTFMAAVAARRAELERRVKDAS